MRCPKRRHRGQPPTAPVGEAAASRCGGRCPPLPRPMADRGWDGGARRKASTRPETAWLRGPPHPHRFRTNSSRACPWHVPGHAIEGMIRPIGRQYRRTRTARKRSATLTKSPKSMTLPNSRQVPKKEQIRSRSDQPVMIRSPSLPSGTQPAMASQESQRIGPEIRHPPGRPMPSATPVRAARPGEHARPIPHICGCSTPVTGDVLDSTRQTLSIRWPSRPKRAL